MAARVFATVLLSWSGALGGLMARPASAAAEPIPFDSQHWEFLDAEAVDHLGRPSLHGTAYLKDVDFDDGIIEFDIAVSGTRSYPGVVFRARSADQYERFYLRPHRAACYPDALQYAPVFNGVTCWQLYTGPGFTAPATLPTDSWVHVRLEIAGPHARAYVGDASRPALVIPELKHGRSRGRLGLLGPHDDSAYFSNFTYQRDDHLAFDPPPAVETPPGTLTDWQLSRSYPAARVSRERYPRFYTIFQAQWQAVTAEPSGLVNISRHFPSGPDDARAAFARTIVSSPANETVKLTLGYSDDVTVFLNGRPLFSGQSGYRSRDPSFVGAVGPYEAVYLPLHRGLNEVCLLVSDSFGGWGFTCRADRALAPPERRHAALRLAWETPADFKVPESVLYDAERRVLYVSSFSRVQAADAGTGFLSKIGLDGQIIALRWVAGLDGPCGMALRGARLYVVECSGHLVEIDADAGQVMQRHPIAGATFLNDLTIDAAGTLYASDTTPDAAGRDVYRICGGSVALFKDGDDLQRANGLLVDDERLIVGSTGDGLLKSVALDDGHVTVIASLGAGVIDGIRADGRGNVLVSHWEGQLYRVSPGGDVVELLDTLPAGLNCADFEFVPEPRLVVVPTFLANKVVAYTLEP